MTPNKRQALYFPANMLEEIIVESKRQDRTISWLIQQAWRIAHPEMLKIPSTTDYMPNKLDQLGTKANE